MMRKLVLGISGKATCGKDTFFTILRELLADDYKIMRFSLGDILKEELNQLPFFQKNRQYSLDKLSGADKEIFRPLMVEYANLLRAKTQGRYFVEILEKKMQIIEGSVPVICCVTDIRFDQYEKDEIYWLKEEQMGKLVHMDRYTTNLDGVRSYIRFVNTTEESQNVALLTAADYFFDWPTTNDKQKLIEYVKPVADKIRQSWLPL